MEPNEQPVEKFEFWAKVSLMGHNERVGKLSVVNTGVEVLYRLDIPQGEASKTEFYGRGAVYSIEPLSEEAARLLAKHLGPPAPISQWDLPADWREAIRNLKEKALPAPGTLSVQQVTERADVESDDFKIAQELYYERHPEEVDHERDAREEDGDF